MAKAAKKKEPLFEVTRDRLPLDEGGFAVRGATLKLDAAKAKQYETNGWVKRV